jgi:hypothetical protein
MTRPKKPAPRPYHGSRNLGVQVSLRAVDEAQKERWEAAASQAGVRLTEWIRGALDAAAQNETARRPR